MPLRVGTTLLLKSTPMVLVNASVNDSSAKRIRRQLFPTPARRMRRKVDGVSGVLPHRCRQKESTHCDTGKR